MVCIWWQMGALRFRTGSEMEAIQMVSYTATSQEHCGPTRITKVNTNTNKIQIQIHAAKMQLVSYTATSQDHCGPKKNTNTLTNPNENEN